jgi:hypothetical protein
MKDKTSTPRATTAENEGEGNRTAARNYNQKTRAFVDAGKVDDAAEAAKAAIDGDEREELEEAEEAGKSKARR